MLLRYYDPSKKSTIQVDASSRGLGEALIQEGKPIAFASKSLTETEQRYANIERELLAVVFGCEGFRTYIYNCSFEVESDHKPLGMICLKNLTAAPPRLQRMLLRLQEYDMVIKYRPGSEMLLADGLSRLPSKKNKEVIDLDIKVDFVQFSTEKLTQIRQATNADPTLCELKVRILKGWPESRRELHKDLQPYWSYWDELSIENGVLLKGDRILIPNSMQPEVLEKLHYGHQGSDKCKLRAKTCVFWSGINNDIDRMMQKWAICQELQKSQTAETLMPHEIPAWPWQIIATDIFSLNGINYLLLVDYYSKYPFIRRLREFSSKEVIGFIKQIFAEQGIPERLISDNGPHFSSQHFREFARAWDFGHITSSPRYPQSNGMAERCVQTVKAATKKAEISSRDINMTLLCLRSTPIDPIIPSPGELLFNRKLVSNLPTKCTNQNFRKGEIQDRLLQRQLTQKRQYDEHAKDLPNLIAGQRVRVQDQDTRRWSPAIIRQACAEPRSYIIETSTGQVLRRNRRHLKEDAYTGIST